MTAKKNQLESLTDQTVRQRLLVRATELIARKGYASTTVREIVAAAGVTKPVLYYYFRNKEGIFLELMGEAWKRFDSLVDDAQKISGSVQEKIIHLMDQVYGLFLEQIEVARVGYSIYYGPPQGAPFFDFDAYHLKFLEVIRGLIQEGMQKKELRKGNVTDMTLAVMGVVQVAIEVRLWHPEMRMDREGLVRVLKLVFDGISGKELKKKGE